MAEKKKGKEARNRSSMAEEGTTAISSPSSYIRKSTSPFSSSFRFIRFADHSNPSPTPGNHFELDECDVFWPAEVSSGAGDSPVSGDIASGLRRPHFPPERFGLSAALAEDSGTPAQKRRPAINVPAARSAAAGMSRMFHQSAPVNVPAWPRGMRKAVRELVEGGDGEEEEEAEEDMLPPHLMVARSRVMTFSVFEGVGRTLKGRDLRRVRNTVFQQTGFLD